jgi:hypothetical protein
MESMRRRSVEELPVENKILSKDLIAKSSTSPKLKPPPEPTKCFTLPLAKNLA